MFLTLKNQTLTVLWLNCLKIVFLGRIFIFCDEHWTTDPMGVVRQVLREKSKYIYAKWWNMHVNCVLIVYIAKMHSKIYINSKNDY